MRSLRVVLPVAVVAAALSGCAVSPKPFTDAEVLSLAKDDYSRVTADQEPVSGPIDLYEAMARALKYNLDQRVEAMGAALRIQELDLAHFSMLPSIVATSGYSARNNVNASDSLNISTGLFSLPYSTSEDERLRRADINFSWDILDFGLSYVRARQAADKYLAAQEQRRKVVARVIEDVRTAYWRAVSADRLISRLSELEARSERAIANAHASEADHLTSPITAATYERELIEIKRSIGELQRDLSVARTQLAALMNVQPGTPFALSGTASAPGLTLTLPLGKMIETALVNRPELHDVWYQRRINDRELDAALLEVLPGLSPYVGSNYDSNDFLYNANWVSWGAKASWNLLKLVQYPAKRDVVEAQGEQLDARALAVTMAVITQVHVSRIRFLQLQRDFATSNRYLAVQRRLLHLMRDEASADRASEQSLIREEMNTLVAEARRDIAYAELQNAFAGVYTAIGLDPYASDIDIRLGVKSLADKLRSVWVERGEAHSG